MSAETRIPYVAESDPDSAAKVHQCLAWIQSEFPSADNDRLHDGDIIAKSPKGEPLIEVQHTRERACPGILQGIVEESGCEIVGKRRIYRSSLDDVETLLWIVPAEEAEKYTQERMEEVTTEWSDGEHLSFYFTVPQLLKYTFRGLIGVIFPIILFVISKMIAPDPPTLLWDITFWSLQIMSLVAFIVFMLYGLQTVRVWWRRR